MAVWTYCLLLSVAVLVRGGAFQPDTIYNAVRGQGGGRVEGGWAGGAELDAPRYVLPALLPACPSSQTAPLRCPPAPPATRRSAARAWRGWATRCCSRSSSTCWASPRVGARAGLWAVADCRRRSTCLCTDTRPPVLTSAALTPALPPCRPCLPRSRAAAGAGGLWRLRLHRRLRLGAGAAGAAGWVSKGAGAGGTGMVAHGPAFAAASAGPWRG